METKIQKWTLNVLGLFFIFFGTFSMDYAIWRTKPEWALWICYVAMVLIGFGILLRLSSLIASQLAIVGIPLLIWNIDFFYQLATRQPLWNVTNYFFSEMLPASRFISLEHFFLIPLGLYALWRIKLKTSKFWIISITQIAIIYALIYFFTRPTENVSCVFYSCVSFIPDGNLYPLTWFGLMFVMIGTMSVVLNWIFLFHSRFLNNTNV